MGIFHIKPSCNNLNPYLKPAKKCHIGNVQMMYGVWLLRSRTAKLKTLIQFVKLLVMIVAT